MKKSHLIIHFLLIIIGICLAGNVAFCEDNLMAAVDISSRSAGRMKDYLRSADRMRNYPKFAADKERVSAKPEKAKVCNGIHDLLECKKVHDRFGNHKSDGIKGKCNFRQYEAGKKVIYYYQRKIGYTVVEKNFMVVLHK
ncbi:MAG: hypothetical protein GY795_15835 [Desulfobacterales bacterium]|nr:hypothetical protein [Desulfobacterales bacterium]